MEVFSVLALIAFCAFNSAVAQDEKCLAAPQRRPCESYEDKERWFFNSTSGRCDSFDWTTCTTGSNSFSDWLECDHACVCQLPSAPTTCVNNWRIGSYQRYFFNKDTNICETFPEGQGCSLNGNYFTSGSSCKMTCVCSLSADPGSGDGQESAFFFNSTSHRCQEFTYTGDGGNANRFPSEEKCKEQCLCGMPMSPGEGERHCMALMPRVWYNSSAGQCENFNYGGCGANNNNFFTMEDCTDACR